MPKVKVGDINIYYEIHGEGEPLVFIWGRGANTEQGKRQAIPAFSPYYQLILFDSRGAGQTDALDIPYTTEMMADDLAGLLDAIGIGSAHVRGLSLGGMIAQQFALRYPERVISLILQCTGFGGSHRVPPDAEVTQLTASMPKMPPEERARAQIPLVVTREFVEKNPGIIQRFVEGMSKRGTPSHGLIRQGQAVTSHNTYDRLPEIKAPTLVIHGDADRMVPVENAHILASRIPNAELVIFKNTGHMFLEAADESSRVILDFLKRHSAKKAW